MGSDVADVASSMLSLAWMLLIAMTVPAHGKLMGSWDGGSMSSWQILIIVICNGKEIRTPAA